MVPTVTDAVSDVVEQRMWIQLYAFFTVLQEDTEMTDEEIIMNTFTLPSVLEQIPVPSAEL